MKLLSLFIVGLLMVSCKLNYQGQKTAILGHGGYTIHHKSGAPPNSIETAKKGLDAGIEGIEIDVHMTSDGVMMVYHDWDLDENSDAKGCIAGMTYSEAKAIKVYDTDFSMNLLEEFFALMKEYDTFIMLDVRHLNVCTKKRIDYAKFNEVLNKLMEPLTPEQRSKIIVNTRDVVLFPKLTDRNIQKSLESDDIDFALPRMKNLKLDMLTIKLSAMTQDIADSLKANNLTCSLYNLKTKGEVKKALDFKPDFIISDNVPLSVQALHTPAQAEAK